jgi:hypothetical protein
MGETKAPSIDETKWGEWLEINLLISYLSSNYEFFSHDEHPLESIIHADTVVLEAVALSRACTYSKYSAAPTSRLKNVIENLCGISDTTGVQQITRIYNRHASDRLNIDVGLLGVYKREHVVRGFIDHLNMIDADDLMMVYVRLGLALMTKEELFSLILCAKQSFAPDRFWSTVVYTLLYSKNYGELSDNLDSGIAKMSVDNKELNYFIQGLYVSKALITSEVKKPIASLVKDICAKGINTTFDGYIQYIFSEIESAIDML